jgi:hypothetical protein
MAVVLGAGVEPDVEPGDAGAGGAEPEGTGTEAGRHRGADGGPERVLLRRGRAADERGEVGVALWRAVATRDDQDGVVAEVREGGDGADR